VTSDDAMPNDAASAGTSGGQVQTTFDATGRPVLRERVTDPGTGSEARTSLGEWSYDQGGAAANALGRLSSTTSHTGMGDFTDAMSYDVRGRATSQTWTYPSELLNVSGGGTSSLTYTYGYNQLDEVTTTDYPAQGGAASAGTGSNSLKALTTTDSYGPYGVFNKLSITSGSRSGAVLGQTGFDDLDRLQTALVRTGAFA